MIRKPSLKHESGERDVQGAENKKEGLVDWVHGAEDAANRWGLDRGGKGWWSGSKGMSNGDAILYFSSPVKKWFSRDVQGEERNANVIKPSTHPPNLGYFRECSLALKITKTLIH